MQRVQGKEEVGGRQVIGFRNERKIRYMNIVQAKSRVKAGFLQSREDKG